MTLVFSDIGGGKDIPEVKPEPIGVILLDKFGNWEIARRDGVAQSGNGPIMGLRRGGLWINNLDFEETRAMFTSAEHKQNVRGAEWLLYGLDEILAEWGYTKLALKPSAGFLSLITGRVFDILGTLLTMRKVRTPEKKLREICRSASLATGMMSLMETGIRKTIPSDEKMRDHFERTYQNGMPYRNEMVADSEIRLDFRFPRLSYAMKMSAVCAPVDADWQKAIRQEGVSEEEFIREVLKIDRPAIFRALFEYDRDVHPRWLGDMIGHKEGTDRTRFVISEMAGVPEIGKQIQSALISKGGTAETVVSTLLEDLAESFGGAEYANLSWTAGLIAENIIAAPHRAGRTNNAAVSGEQVWLAAQDRMLMAPLMRALTEAGCLIASARGGRVSVLCPKAPEVIVAATSLAWDHGAFLPMGQANQLRALHNIDLPTERSAFLGGDSDYLVAVANHRGDKKVLWGLDGICDAQTPKERKKAAEAILGW